MKIEIGKFYTNKTWRFLLPCLRGHGHTFVSHFNPVFKLGVGIQDNLVMNSEFSNGRNIFILCDKKYQEKAFLTFLDWIKDEPYYKADYCPDADFTKSRKHMVVLELPEYFYNAYDRFLVSHYSKMFDSEQLEMLFSIESRKTEYNILTKNTTEIPKFIKKVNDTFNSTISVSDFDTGEVELPLVNREEIFNYTGTRTFFDIARDKTWKIKN